jgi:hypothetical protein
MKVQVVTTLAQLIEVPEGTDKQEVYDFLAENQSFRDAFLGLSDQDQTFRIVDVLVIDEEVTEMGEAA